jgi:hypothetical protein
VVLRADLGVDVLLFRDGKMLQQLLAKALGVVTIKGAGRV